MGDITRNFSYAEFIKSDTAKQQKIANGVASHQFDNMFAVLFALQEIRDEFGEPIVITSGYRSKELNLYLRKHSKVTVAMDSDHCYAAAVDFRPQDNTPAKRAKLWNITARLVKAGKLKLRQIIWEYGTKEAPNWIHISVNHKAKPVKSNQFIYYYS